VRLDTVTVRSGAFDLEDNSIPLRRDACVGLLPKPLPRILSIPYTGVPSGLSTNRLPFSIVKMSGMPESLHAGTAMPTPTMNVNE